MFFVKIWNNLSNFREESGLFTWIYRIASNECLNFLSKKKRFLFIPLLDIEQKLLDAFTIKDGFNGDEIQVKLQKAIIKLPDKQRLIFNMKYFDGLSYEEISAIVGTSVGALKASYHFAVKKIEKYLEGN